MVTVEIGNSYSKINGLTPTAEKELRSLLSYTVDAKAAYFGRGYARKKSLLSKRCEFPTGLLHRLPYNKFTIDSLIDNRIIPNHIPVVMTDPTAYYWQNAAYLECIKKGRGIVSAPTGTGKSRLISMLCRSFYKVLVVVPTLEIKKQLIQSINSSRVIVENIDSKALNSLVDFDCLIIDEGHHVAAKTYQKLNKTAWKGIYYRYFVTATPFRNDAEEQLLFESIAGEVIYKLSYQAAIKERYIVPVEAYYFESPKQKTEVYTYQQVYSELVVSNVAKNQRIINVLTSLHSAGKSTLCLVKEAKHGKILSELTGLPFVSGVDEESRKYIQAFNKGTIKVLIGTTAMLGEGIDTKPCEYVVIACLGKAKSAFMQQVGRALRTYPGKDSGKVILIQDRSHRFLSRHFKIQCAILKEEYGVIPTKLEL